MFQISIFLHSYSLILLSAAFSDHVSRVVRFAQKNKKAEEEGFGSLAST